MPHIRVFRHYIHTPFLLLAGVELVIISAAAYFGFYTHHQSFPSLSDFFLAAIVFALVLLAAMVAMGVYESRVREGMTGMSLRTAVAIFLLGASAVAFLDTAFPALKIGRHVLFFAAIEAFLMLWLFRWVVFSFSDENLFKTRVVVLGVGRRAEKIASRMRRRSDQRAFVLIGFIAPDEEASEEVISSLGVRIFRDVSNLHEFCQEWRVDEIVVAMDERRHNPGEAGGLPLNELMECKLSGLGVCDVQQFIEREACKVDVDLLRPSWLVFSDGFAIGPWRAALKRLFDIVASLILLSIAWPIMLLAAAAIRLDTPGRVLYQQTRIGLDGQPFKLLKFRSMVTGEDDSEWTAPNDPRITRVGGFMRRARIDELPQLFNVLSGRMSFVGPRPERPIIVSRLKDKLPFYDQRHRLKPGITGWAQLCYPYGGSVEDSKQKLQYDLYYLKNNSLLLDLIIILQTVEVILIGEGAR